MKMILLFVSLFVLCTLSAETISRTDAKQVGENFFSSMQNTSYKSSRMISLNEVEISLPAFKSSSMADPSFYVFNEESMGFVIVSGDDRVKPILGYSMKGHIDGSDLPDAFLEMLNMYAYEIEFARKNDIDNSLHNNEWNELLDGATVTKSSAMTSALLPLLTTSWNQRPYYNALCPQDLESGNRAVTGCVATALAQVLNYHEYPPKAEGYYSYVENDFGLQNVLFFDAAYGWSKMPDMLNASSLPEEHAALTQLMYHCGVGVRMNYGLGQSGATMGAVRSALRNYFAYDNLLDIRSKGTKTFSEWEMELKAELDESRPIFYAGFGKGSGHAFILDGYSDDQFHINWGWGGSSDGYFPLTALNPGSYPSGFNAWQMGIFGVKPRENYLRHDIELNKALSFQNDTIYHLSPVDVTVDIKNNSVEDFKGYLSLIFFDKDTVEVNYVGGKYGINLAQGETLLDDTLLHINKLYLSPGSYLAALFYRTNGGMIDVEEGLFSNFIEIELASSAGVGELFMADSMILEDSVPITRDSLNIMLHIANGGIAEYNGEVRAEVYNNWGDQVAVLDSVAVLGLSPGDTANIKMHVDTLNLSPGRYYLRLFEKPDGETNHLELNSNAYLNPQPFVVLPVPPKGDKYENNDSMEVATQLVMNQSGSYFSYTIDSASIHIDKDKDFYEFVMPEGSFTYTAWMNLVSVGGRDKGEEQGGMSSFHMLAHVNGQVWGPWENYSSESIPMEAGDTLRIEVFPFFLGLTGDYALQMSVNQSVVTVKEPVLATELSIYPNPATDRATIQSFKEMSKLKVFAMDGKEIISKALRGKKTILDLSVIRKGTYFISIDYSDGSRELRKLQVLK